MSDTATEETHPESLSGLRKAVEKNTAKSDAALEWSVKTYQLVKPVAEGMSAAQERSRVAARESRYSLIAAALALVVACAGLACSVLQ